MTELRERPALASLPGLHGRSGRNGRSGRSDRAGRERRAVPAGVALAIVLTGQIMAVLDRTARS